MHFTPQCCYPKPMPNPLTKKDAADNPIKVNKMAKVVDVLKIKIRMSKRERKMVPPWRIKNSQISIL